MTENSALAAIRRRWWVVVLFALVGAGLGALPEPDTVEDIERRFRATHTLLLNSDNLFETDLPVSPSQLTLFATTGEVPLRAATMLDYPGNPASLAAQVQANFDQTNGALTISSTQIRPADAEEYADAFADELVSYLAERQDESYQDRLAAALEREARAEEALIRVTNELAADEEDPVLLAQQNAISRQYSVAFEQSEALSEEPGNIQLTTLERAQAVEVTETGIGAPRSRQSRAILGAAVGFVIGLAVALLLGRLDRRIRTRAQAEEVYEMRARAIVPKVRDADRDTLIVASDRHDPLTDAYRTVRNLVLFVQENSAPGSRGHITLVVSPSPGDGKTALAVNLAAAMAESGRRTVLVNSDFRRPRMIPALGPDAQHPPAVLLEDVQSLGPRSLLSRSGRSNLRVFDLSSVDGTAVELVRATTAKLDELAEASDHIVIDTSPVGATAEVLELVPYADTIVLVSRIGHTKIAPAQRAVTILRDLTEVPMLLVLGGLKRERGEYYEYTDRRRSKKTKDSGESAPPKKRRFGRRKKTAEVPPAVVEDSPETLPFEEAEPVGSDFTPWTGLGTPESELDASVGGEQPPTPEPVIDVEAASARADDGGGDESPAGDEFRFEAAE